MSNLEDETRKSSILFLTILCRDLQTPHSQLIQENTIFNHE